VRINSKLKTQNPKPTKLVPALLDWFVTNARDLPWRSRKAGRDPYAIWVSEIMLQQTQVKTVIPYWERWLRELATIRAVANANPDRIHKLWEGLGYYTRARNLQKAAQQIVEKHGGKFPENFDDVLALPGIGRYTAGAICSIAFNQPTPILDGNVIRVLTRIFGIAENPKGKVTNARLWKLAEELVGRAVSSPPRRGRDTAPYPKTSGKPTREDTRPTNNWNCSHLNQSLMELGALICTPRNPQCDVCPVKKLCVAYQEKRVEKLPNLGQRAVATARRFVAFVVEQNGRFLVRQRPAGVVNAHLWEFPNVEIGSSQGRSPALRDESAHYPNKNGESRLTSAATVQKFDPEIAFVAKQLGLEPYEATPFCTVKHSITRYRITLKVFRASHGGTSGASPHLTPLKPGACITRPSEMRIWRTPAQLHQLAFSSAHKKILEQLPVA
jgi:A/G-specific adenine glycosylase